MAECKRVRITCRCGMQSVAVIPRQVLEGVNLHPCPQCGRMFTITYQDRQWVIAAQGNVRDGAYQNMSEETEDGSEN
jgi:hypothetical protein